MGKLTVDNGCKIKSLEFRFADGKKGHWVAFGSIVEGGWPIDPDTGEDEKFTGQVRIQFDNGQAREVFILDT